MKEYKLSCVGFIITEHQFVLNLSRIGILFVFFTSCAF